MTDLEAAAYITLLFLAFAFTHSLFVDDRVKSFIAKLTGETFFRVYYRFLYTCFSILSVAIVFYLIRKVPDRTLLVIPDWLKVIFVLILLTGVVIGILAFRVISILDFLGLAQIYRYWRYKTIEGDIEGIKDDRLITTGIYGVVRHPLYLAGILIVTFHPVITRTSVCIALLADLYFIVGAILEEKRLIKRFGRQYLEYRQRVPRFIPKLSR